MGFSRKELRDSCLDATRQQNSQIGSLVNDFINLSLARINYPGWAYRNNHNHLWTWLKRKNTITATAEDYVLGREVDKIAVVRQISTPTLLKQIPDDVFYDYVPYPQAGGDPRYYRLWEVEGVTTRLTSSGLLDVLSSSTSDAGSAELAVSITGFINGIQRTETYQLNGTTAVAGSLTFQAREVYVQKQKNTTGTITVRRNSDSSSVVVLSPTDRAPKFKVISFYPIPTSTAIYLEYYTNIPSLYNDSDVPAIPEQFHYVVRLGIIAEIYRYLNKEQDLLGAENSFAAAVRAMVAADTSEPDLIEILKPRRSLTPYVYQKLSDDAII
jgi:hypothetical protein